MIKGGWALIRNIGSVEKRLVSTLSIGYDIYMNYQSRVLQINLFLRLPCIVYGCLLCPLVCQKFQTTGSVKFYLNYTSTVTTAKGYSNQRHFFHRMGVLPLEPHREKGTPIRNSQWPLQMGERETFVAYFVYMPKVLFFLLEYPL